MANYDRELKAFEMEIYKNFQRIADHRARTQSLYHHSYIKKLRSQAKNVTILGTESVDGNHQSSDLDRHNVMDMQNVVW